VQAWEKFVQREQEELGAAIADRWLRSLKVIHFDACNLYLEAKDSFHILWFEEHIRPKIHKKLLNNNHHPIKVHLSTAGEGELNPRRKHSTKKTPESLKQAAPPLLHLDSDPLDPAATFDNFVVGEANQLPYQLLSELSTRQSENTQAHFWNPLYLYGGEAVGKSHLLMASAASFKKRGLNVLFIRAQTFTDHVVFAIRNGVMQEFRKAYRHVDVLIIDDIHLLARRIATQEELFHTFNTLYIEKKQILLSANCAPQQLSDIEPRLISRFEWGIAIPLEKPTSEERAKILVKRCEAHNFILDQEILNFLMQTFHRTPSSLHLALDALLLRAHLDIRSSKMTLDKAREYLVDLLKKEEEAVVTPHKIVQKTAHFFGIRIEDILGKAQTQECVLPRQISMYLCRNRLYLSFSQIGRFFSRDHSTVMSSVKQIQEMMDIRDAELSSSLAAIIRKLDE
jgi:chromosomal replication initiator protein